PAIVFKQVFRKIHDSFYFNIIQRSLVNKGIKGEEIKPILSDIYISSYSTVELPSHFTIDKKRAVHAILLIFHQDNVDKSRVTTSIQICRRHGNDFDFLYGCCLHAAEHLVQGFHGHAIQFTINHYLHAVLAVHADRAVKMVHLHARRALQDLQRRPGRGRDAALHIDHHTVNFHFKKRLIGLHSYLLQFFGDGLHYNVVQKNGAL